MLRIRAWDEAHENNRTRELKRLEWVPVPNRMDGDAYLTLLDDADGAAHFGAWVAILEIASRCNPRGVLQKADGTPHNARSLSRISRIPADVFDVAIPRLIEIGWLVEAPIPHGGAGIPHETATPMRDGRASHACADVRADTPARARSEWNGTERMEGGDARTHAREEPGAKPPDPRPHLSAAPPPDSESEPSADDGFELTAESVQHQWTEAARARGKVAGVVSRKLLEQVAQACPDPQKRWQAFIAVFEQPAPPAFRFVAEELPTWIARGESIAEQEARAIPRDDPDPPRDISAITASIGRDDHTRRSASEQTRQLRESS